MLQRGTLKYQEKQKNIHGLICDRHDDVVYCEDTTALSCFCRQANFNNCLLVFPGEKKNLNNTILTKRSGLRRKMTPSCKSPIENDLKPEMTCPSGILSVVQLFS